MGRSRSPSHSHSRHRSHRSDRRKIHSRKKHYSRSPSPKRAKIRHYNDQKETLSANIYGDDDVRNGIDMRKDDDVIMDHDDVRIEEVRKEDVRKEDTRKEDDVKEDTRKEDDVKEDVGTPKDVKDTLANNDVADLKLLKMECAPILDKIEREEREKTLKLRRQQELEDKLQSEAVKSQIRQHIREHVANLVHNSTSIGRNSDMDNDDDDGGSNKKCSSKNNEFRNELALLIRKEQEGLRNLVMSIVKDQKERVVDYVRSKQELEIREKLKAKEQLERIMKENNSRIAAQQIKIELENENSSHEMRNNDDLLSSDALPSGEYRSTAPLPTNTITKATESPIKKAIPPPPPVSPPPSTTIASKDEVRNTSASTYLGFSTFGS